MRVVEAAIWNCQPKTAVEVADCSPPADVVAHRLSAEKVGAFKVEVPKALGYNAP